MTDYRPPVEWLQIIKEEGMNPAPDPAFVRYGQSGQPGLYASSPVLLKNGKPITGYRPPVELLQIIKEQGMNPALDPAFASATAKARHPRQIFADTVARRTGTCAGDRHVAFARPASGPCGHGRVDPQPVPRALQAVGARGELPLVSAHALLDFPGHRRKP